MESQANADTSELLGQEVPPPKELIEHDEQEKKTPILTLIISILFIVASIIAIIWAFNGGSISDLMGESETEETGQETVVAEGDTEEDDGTAEDTSDEENLTEDENPLDAVVSPDTSCDTIVDFDTGEVSFDELEPEAVMSSPYTLSGTVPGTWMFEGSFTAVLYDEDGIELGEWILSVEEGEDWMTEDDVSFSGELEFDPGDSVGGTLVLQAANPSAEEGNCREMHLVVAFE